MADCTQAPFLTADLGAQYLLADRGYDTNAIVAEAVAQGMEPVIPPRSHRKEPRYYDRIYTDCVIWWSMHSWTSSSGEAWQLGMPKERLRSSPFARLEPLPSGPSYFDDTA